MRMQFKRLCSALLAAIMVVTAVPGMELTSYAAQIEEEGVAVVDTELEEDGTTAMDETTEGIHFEYRFQKNITEEEQQEILQQVKVQNADGTQDYGTSIPFNGEESITFHLEFPEGYTVTAISVPKITRFRAVRNYANNNYTIRSGYKGEPLAGICDISIVIGRIRDTELYVEYPDTIESVEVLYNSEKVEIVNDRAQVSNAGAVVVKVKPQENQIITAKYETEDASGPTNYTASYNEEGYYYYGLGKILSDTSMVFTTAEGVDLSICLDEGISGYVHGLPEDIEGMGISLENGTVVTAKKESNLYIAFGVDDTFFGDSNLVITSTLEDGTVTEIPWSFNDENWEYVCNYKVTDEAVISFQWVPKKAHKVTFVTENVAVNQCTYDEEFGDVYLGEQYPEDVQLNIYDGGSVTFAVCKDLAYTLEVTLNGKTEEALKRISSYDDGEGNIFYIYRYTPTEDTIIRITAQLRERYEMSYQWENASFYIVSKDEEGYHLSEADGDTCTSTCYEEDTAYFAVSYGNAYKVESVNVINGEQSNIKCESSYTDDGETFYCIYSYIPTTDSTISINVVEKEKHILTFECDSATIEGYYGFSTTENVSEYELYEGTYTFFVKNIAEGTKVELVTTTGDTENMQAGKLVPYYDGEMKDYYYSIKLTEDTTITVVTAAKEQHEVQVSAQNVTIENVTGSFASTDNNYSVYHGDTLSFKVTPQEGFEIGLVSVAGEKVQKLYPVSEGKSKIYTVKVGKDMTIQVETTKKTASTVSFNTNHVVVSCENPLDNEDKYIAYKEEPFVFTVEAEEGYVLDTVSANGEELEPIYEPYSGTCYYQIEVEEDVTVEVNAKLPERHQVTFVDEQYTNGIRVWTENGNFQEELLDEQNLTVSSNEVIWFDIPGEVDMANKVVCTNESGETKNLYRTCHNGNEGYYLGNITEDMQINIASRAETYAVTFRSLKYRDEKFMPVTGVGTYPETIYVPLNEGFDFRVAAEDGWELNTVKVSGRVTVTGSLETGIYHVEPRTDKGSSDVAVYAGSRKVAHTEYVLDYPEEEVAVTVLVDGEEIPTVNGAFTALTTQDITVKLKPLTNKLLGLYGCYRNIAELPVSTEEDGTQVYEFTYGDISNISDGHLRVTADEYYSVEFTGEDITLINGTLIGYTDEGGKKYAWEEVEETLKVKKGSELVFRVATKEGYAVSEIKLSDDTAGMISKKTIYHEDEEGNIIAYQCYSMKPEKDVSITITTEQLPGYDYNFVYDSSKVDLYMGYYSYYYDKWDYEIVWEEGDSEYRKITQDGAYNKVMFRVVPKEGYVLSLVSTTEDRSGQVPTAYDYMSEVRYYYLPNTEDATITIQADEIADYNLTIECEEGIREVYVGGNTLTFEDGNKKTVKVSNTDSSYFTIYEATKWVDESEIELYNIVSVTEDGKELELVHDFENSIGAYYIPNFIINKDTTIVIKTEINPEAVNTTTFSTNGDKNGYKAYHYVEIEDEDGNVERKKEYLDLDKELYLFDRSDAIGLEAAEGYEIGTVEFKRGDKVKTLTPNEEGLYPIWYPLSMGLEGTFEVTVYREKTMAEKVTITGITEGKVSQDVDTVKEYELNFTPLDAELSQIGVEVIPTEGQPVDVVQAEIADGKLRLTIADVAACENAATVKIYDVDAKTGEKVYVEGGTFQVTTVKQEELEETKAENVTITGITEGKVSQDVDTIKEYELNFAPVDANLSQIGVEVIPTEGQPADVVQAEIADGKLCLTTAAVSACKNAATVKIYDVDAKTGEKVYVEGGNFTVSTMSPAALEEGCVKAEVLSVNDAVVKLGLTAPEGLIELNAGMYYYKVQIVPQVAEGAEIPAEILNAARNPYYIAKEGDTQEIQLLLNANGVGKGQEWGYEIKVSMVQTSDKDGLVNIASKELFESKQETLKNVRTKNPYYQETVTFANAVKQVYTTQENLVAAQVVFDENNSDPKVVEVRDITELNGKGSALTVWEENGTIYVTVPKDTMVGKHTIEVTLDAPEHMNPAQGTFQFNVFKGIETMEVTVPAVSVYKQNGKAVTIKAGLTYNQDTTAPKIRKADWQIVKADGEALTKADALYEMVTVKNGKVTVNKNYVPTETVSDNQFCIKASAADYEGNTVYGLSDVITLTNKPTEIGGIYLMAAVEGGYQVVVKEGSSITTDVLDSAFVAVLKEKIEEGKIYTEEELKLLSISSEKLTYKTSNKAVVIQKKEKVTLSAVKAAKNIKLAVTTNDGGKKKAELKFTIVYAQPKEIALEIADRNQVLGEIAAKEVTFKGTTNTRLTVKVKQKDKDVWTDLNALVNYKLSIKGGKIISSDTVKGIYEIIITGKQATVTLDNKTTGVKKKDTYQITNTAYSDAKAPKVKSTEKLICGVKPERSITYTLGGKYDYKNKYVMVETDYISRTEKTKANYEQFESASVSSNNLIAITTDGKFTLNFNENPIPAGNYKLKFTFGTGTEAENFIADAKPVTVTLKVVKPKVTKGSYAPVKSYKIEAKAGASVMLTGKGKNLVDNSLLYFDLKNANIKGKQNDFLSYFELKDGKLLLRNDVTEEDITYLKSKSGKNDLNAYISYKVAYGDDGYGNPFTVNKTIKLKIKLK